MNDPELYSCPYCGSDNYLSYDLMGGKKQKLVVDCEICCQPIVIELTVQDGSVLRITARKENE
ncbi:MAG: CPXCG motif-containing cysteine-rich protein [Candidatus Omnitrophica bacterium]|nr:CPXCG motif-containing cysteine-rich protein [Candidatus Omnitrophota bacterium]